MPDHYFTPHLAFRGGQDPTWIAEAIEQWERGTSAEVVRIVGSGGRPLPPWPALAPGTVEHRFGAFREDPALLYRLRLEVGPGARGRVTVGVLFSGPGDPAPDTRGGGDLIDVLSRNWRHKPLPEMFPSRLRIATSRSDIAELFARLVDALRRIPLVIVTRRSRSEEPVADPESLTQAMRGMAEVWSLPETGATFELGREFASRGFDERWNCYDGGARVYLPGLDPAQDELSRHPLVLADRLLSRSDPTNAATSWALAVACRALGSDEWRERWRAEFSEKSTQGDSAGVVASRLREHSGFVALVTKLDSHTETGSRAADDASSQPSGEQRVPRSELELERSEPADDDAGTDHADAEPTADDARMSSADDGGEPDIADQGLNRMSRAQRGMRSLSEAFEAFSNLEELLKELEQEVLTLRAERDALATERDELSQELQDREQSPAKMPTTVAAVLELVSQLDPARLRVTGYALRKSRTSRFGDIALLSSVLMVLMSVGPGFGIVDTELQRRFGRRCRARPKESPQTMAKFGDNRTFKLDDGRLARVEQHVTLGHGSRNLHETLQLYWRCADDDAVEVVYAGPHLPTVSANT